MADLFDERIALFNKHADSRDEALKIPVTMLFMLALKEAHQQLNMLMKLMDAFQNDELMEKFEAVDNFDDYYKLIEESGLDLEE